MRNYYKNVCFVSLLGVFHSFPSLYAGLKQNVNIPSLFVNCVVKIPGLPTPAFVLLCNTDLIESIQHFLLKLNTNFTLFCADLSWIINKFGYVFFIHRNYNTCFCYVDVGFSELSPPTSRMTVRCQTKIYQ